MQYVLGTLLGFAVLLGLGIVSACGLLCVRRQRSVPYFSSRFADYNDDDDEESEPRDHKVRLDFVSHGRRFELELERDHTVFGDRLEVVDAEERRLRGGAAADTSHIYHGTVKGRANRGKK